MLSVRLLFIQRNGAFRIVNNKQMTQKPNSIYIRPPREIIDGIPVFSEFDRYIKNYEKIASNHLASMASGNNNPYMTTEQIDDSELVTRKAICQHVPAGKRILDAGVGLGGLLAPLQNYQRFGVDVSLGYLSKARQQGIHVTLTKLEDLPYLDGYFDAVVSCDVLEHVLYLDQAVNQILRVLKPGGILVVRVPNLENLESYLDDAQSYTFSHVRQFGLESLRLYFERAFGLKYIEHEYAGYAFNIAAQLKIKLPSSKDNIRTALDKNESAPADLEIIRNAISITEEELVDAVISLRDNHPVTFKRLAPGLINPIEINIVFKKPVEPVVNEVRSEHITPKSPC